MWQQQQCASTVSLPSFPPLFLHLPSFHGDNTNNNTLMCPCPWECNGTVHAVGGTMPLLLYLPFVIYIDHVTWQWHHDQQHIVYGAFPPSLSSPVLQQQHDQNTDSDNTTTETQWQRCSLLPLHPFHQQCVFKLTTHFPLQPHSFEHDCSALTPTMPFLIKFNHPIIHPSSSATACAASGVIAHSSEGLSVVSIALWIFKSMWKNSWCMIGTLGGSHFPNHPFRYHWNHVTIKVFKWGSKVAQTDMPNSWKVSCKE